MYSFISDKEMTPNFFLVFQVGITILCSLSCVQFSMTYESVCGNEYFKPVLFFLIHICYLENSEFYTFTGFFYNYFQVNLSKTIQNVHPATQFYRSPQHKYLQYK